MLLSDVGIRKAKPAEKIQHFSDYSTAPHADKKNRTSSGFFLSQVAQAAVRVVFLFAANGPDKRPDKWSGCFIITTMVYGLVFKVNE